MSNAYDQYLITHKLNVARGFEWIKKNLPDLLNDDADFEWQITMNHDTSKSSEEEYDAYDTYFYKNKSYAATQEFDKAWLHHIHCNEHHWQHWILYQDDPNSDRPQLLEIPYLYIIEMICDWWSFSWNTGDLYVIFTWYDDHRHNMLINPKSRFIVEQILGKIKAKLEEKDNAHE